MPLILGTNSIKDTGFNVSNSLRFNDDDTAYMTSPTRGTATSQKKGTFSFWMKLSEIGQVRMIGTYENGNNEFSVKLTNDSQLEIYQIAGGSNNLQLKTNRVFRDPSAWMHVVLAVDTLQSTQSDRAKLYINGVEETSFATNTNSMPSGHSFHGFYQGLTQRIGADAGSTSHTYDGYFAEFVYIDGLALTPTSFGEFDSDSPTIWKPIDVSGLTFGNNGYYLQFKQSGTSQNSSGLGADTSGNDNHFAVTNLAATDQSTDTCTNNFATLNPLVKGNASITLSEGNLKGVFPGSWTAIPATFGLTKGKWYFEAKNETSGQNAFIGVVTENQDWDDSTPYDETTGVVLYGPGGRKTVDGTDTDGFFATLSSGQIVGVALDLDSSTKTIQFSVNGTDTPNSTPVDLPSTFDNVFIFPYFLGNSSSATSNWEINFGSPPYSISSGNSDANGYGNFEYSVPSGFYSINTKNLAEFG